MRKAFSLFFAVMLAIVGMLFTVSQAYAGGKGHGHDPVTICHKGKTIVVDDDAVPAHLKHGDTLGECEPEVVVPEQPDDEVTTITEHAITCDEYSERTNTTTVTYTYDEETNTWVASEPVTVNGEWVNSVPTDEQLAEAGLDCAPPVVVPEQPADQVVSFVSEPSVNCDTRLVTTDSWDVVTPYVYDEATNTWVLGPAMDPSNQNSVTRDATAEECPAAEEPVVTPPANEEPPTPPVAEVPVDATPVVEAPVATPEVVVTEVAPEPKKAEPKPTPKIFTAAFKTDDDLAYTGMEGADLSILALILLGSGAVVIFAAGVGVRKRTI